MQTRGTFPALSDGHRKSRRNSGTYARDDRGMGSFVVKRAPKALANPRSLAGRRAASHRKVNAGR